jgi:hypothetical protein
VAFIVIDGTCIGQVGQIVGAAALVLKVVQLINGVKMAADSIR